MQKYLFACICVLATFVLIDAKPWYNYDDCDEDHDHAMGDHSGGYRNYVAYSDRYRSYNRESEFQAGGTYYGGGQGGGGYVGAFSGGSHGGGGYDVGGYSGRQYSGERQGDRRPYNYIPENCPGCNIKTFGVGRGMRNTFNLPAV